MINKCKTTPFKAYSLHLGSILFIYLIVFLCACEGQKSKKTGKEEGNNKQEQKTVTFPKLNTKNVASFLLSYGETLEANHVKIVTNLGEITVKLFDDTPIHRANFLMLINRKYYEGTQFYRVIKDFVIQGGGSDDPQFKGKQRQIGKYKFPSEFKKERYHKRGALSMARVYKNNPEKMSNSYEFFIVQGIKYNQAQLDVLAEEENKTYSSQQAHSYINEGGAPHLDMEHTVFGEVVEGMDIVDKIANVEVNEEDYWPTQEVKILKMIPFKK